MNHNLSTLTDDATARTSAVCASQRAENLAALGATRVLELCVGPSLRALEEAYGALGISVVGNDIDPRWHRYYPHGKWIVGDARTIARMVTASEFDAVVVAPPLSRGCSGRRDDSLSMDLVTPGYYDFIALDVSMTAFVLPGRTLSVRRDRAQLHRLLGVLRPLGQVDVVPLRDRVVKYVDVYLVRKPNGG